MKIFYVLGSFLCATMLSASFTCKTTCTAKMAAQSGITKQSADFPKICKCLKDCKVKTYIGTLDAIKNFSKALLSNQTLSADVSQAFAVSFVDGKDQHLAMGDLEKLKGPGNSQLFNIIKAEADKYDSLKQTQIRAQAMQADIAAHARMAAALAQQQELLKRLNAAQAAAKR